MHVLLAAAAAAKKHRTQLPQHEISHPHDHARGADEEEEEFESIKTTGGVILSVD